jgi:hypothetical protein
LQAQPLGQPPEVRGPPRRSRGGGAGEVTPLLGTPAARATLSPSGPRFWQSLTHQSACLSCAWGTGGQNGGFRDELGEPLQRCLKSVEAIGAEPRAAMPLEVSAGRTLSDLQRLSMAECAFHGRPQPVGAAGAAPDPA